MPTSEDETPEQRAMVPEPWMTDRSSFTTGELLYVTAVRHPNHWPGGRVLCQFTAYNFETVEVYDDRGRKSAISLGHENIRWVEKAILPGCPCCSEVSDASV